MPSAILDPTKTLPAKRRGGRPAHDAPDKVDIGKALKLRLQGNSFEQIGLLLCPEKPLSRQAIAQALEPFSLFLKNPEAVEAYQGNKASLLESVELTLVKDLLDDEKRQKASLNNVAYSMSQVSQQLRLERGPSALTLAVPAAIQSAIQVSLRIQVAVNSGSDTPTNSVVPLVENEITGSETLIAAPVAEIVE